MMPLDWRPILCLVLLGLPPAVEAQNTTKPPAPDESANAADDTAGEDAEQPPTEDVTLSEVMVVTASRSEQQLHELPTALTVISEEAIEAIPSDDYGDLLRNVPGLNVTQLSARDLAITGREATFTLANKQLALVDGRSLYLDFLGFVMWDLLPVNAGEIKQIEVVRGPGSAVWGANAMTGVVNVITKTPAEMAGTAVTLGAGELDTLYGSVTHAGVRGPLSYRVTGGYFEQDPYERPTGTIPGSETPYPDFPNQGTAQPKLDLRLDVQPSTETRWSFSSGYAGTDGILHSGLGPFQILDGSELTYAKAEWSRRALRVSLDVTAIDGAGENLLTVGVGGSPIRLAFQSETYNLDATDTRVVADAHVLTYGANAKHNAYDLSIAPLGSDRDELGAFLQDEILFGERVRWLIGARVDDIDPIGTVVSPRTSLLVSPTPRHTFRVSYNRAFRAPTLVESSLDIEIENVLPIPAVPELGIPEPIDFLFRTAAVGDPELEEEKLDAYEIGYVATPIDGMTFDLSLYRSELEGGVDFFASRYYSADDPPAGWPLPNFVLDLPQLEGRVPAVFSYRNVNQITNQGLEAALQMRMSRAWSWFANYSYQDRPEATGVSEAEINLPPTNRFNLGTSFSGERLFASINVNHSDGAFWTDVLDSRYFGPTDAFTQLGATAGMRWADGRHALSVIAQNLTDERVQQHVFGDVISRKVVVQLALRY